MQKNIFINGVDRSAYCAQYGYSVQYKKIKGKAGGTMLDGSTTEDIIAIKAIVTIPLLPLTESQMSELIADIYADDYVKLNYFDIRENAYREAEFIYSEASLIHIMENIDKNEMWKFKAIKFTER